MGFSPLRSFKNIWGHGDDDDYAHDEIDAPDNSEPNRSSYGGDSSYRSDKYTSPPAPAPAYGGGSAGGAGRRLRPVATPLRAREKNIYTLKPKSQDEASIAADYLKTGSAVVLNLEEVDRLNAVRIIDFMSGVCYGLEGQGHAMKLGETIFLFTPAEFEISSDETDYAENREFFFKDVSPLPTASPGSRSMSGAGGATTDAPSIGSPGAMPSWER